MLRHALTVVEFIENESKREQLELEATVALAKWLLGTGQYEEAGPLIQRWRKLVTDSDRLLVREGRATDAAAMIGVLASAVHFQAVRGDVERAKKEMKVLPCRSLSSSSSQPTRWTTNLSSKVNLPGDN